MEDEIFSCLGKKICSSLLVTLKNEGILGGPFSSRVNLDYKGSTISVEIEQCVVRAIKLTANIPIALAQMWDFYTQLERLLMLLDGRFYNIESLAFEGGALTQEGYTSYARECLSRRLPYYKTDPVYCYSCHQFLNFDVALSAKIYLNWIHLQEELDIVHQVILYNVADTGVPHEIKCANFIECLEPMAEIIGVHDSFFPSLQPGDRSTTLKLCIDAVISKFGKDIFASEYSINKNKFLQILVNTRNRIMHIKRNQPTEKFLSNTESILYLVKFFHLYRVVLLSLLGIDYEIYREKVIKSIEQWDSWNDILNHFINSLK